MTPAALPLFSRFESSGYAAFPEKAAHRENVQAVLSHESLVPLFQPIVDMTDHHVLGFEGLIRGPLGSPLHDPVSLFQAARAAHRLHALEAMCHRIHAHAFKAQQLPGYLFLNVSPDVLMAQTPGTSRVVQALCDLANILPHRIVVELTESGVCVGYAELRQAVGHLRQAGIAIALDDFGEGVSNLRLWSEIRPDYIKLDKHFTQQIERDPVKQQLVRAIQAIAQASGALVIAEGIETVTECQALQALGIRYGQGYWFGRPQAQPDRILQYHVL